MLASRIKQMMHQSPWWSVWALLMLLSSLWLALYLHQFIDYGFGAWYQLLDIYQHIQTFAPQNYYKSGFAQLSDQDYSDLFGQISWAINHGGETLASISYTVKGETILLLRPPEVVHLQDVAQLIERVNRLGIVMVVASSALTIFLLYRRIPLSWWAVCGQLLCVIAVVTAALFIIGPK